MSHPASEDAPRSRRSGMRLMAVGVSAVAVIAVVAGVALASLRGDTPPPARLGDAPEGSAQGPSAPDGVWTLIADGTSFVGYRTRERIGPISVPGETVGRTTALTGELNLTPDAITRVRVTADMTELHSNTELRDESMKSAGLETDDFPEATFELTEPVPNVIAQRGEILELRAVGDLSLHGVTRSVDVAIQARWNGPTIQIAGSIPIELSDFAIDVTTNPVFAGLHVDGRGTAEFELIFTHGAGPAEPVDLGSLRDDPEATPAFAPPDPPCGTAAASEGTIVFGSPRDLEEEGDDLWKANTDGSGLTRLTDTPTMIELDPAASPDGTMIAYSVIDLATGEPTVWLMGADGSDQHPLLTEGPSAQLAPAWSPDGTRLVFSGGSVEVPWDVQLYIANLDGSGVEQLTASDGRFHGAAAWSPDGTAVAYESYAQEGADEIVLVSVSTRESRQLTETPGYDSTPEWVDERNLLFSRDGRLTHLDVTTGETTPGDDQSVGYGIPKLSPAGTTVLVGRNGNLYTTTVDGADRACVPVGRTANGGDWLPG